MLLASFAIIDRYERGAACRRRRRGRRVRAASLCALPSSASQSVGDGAAGISGTPPPNFNGDLCTGAGKSNGFSSAAASAGPANKPSMYSGFGRPNRSTGRAARVRRPSILLI